MSKKITINGGSQKADNQGWHTNTDLGCDVKTFLLSNKRMKTGKGYRGVFRLDSEAVAEEFLYRDPHYTFVETVPTTNGKRNPRVYDGKFVTITRWDDGSLHPNLKQVCMKRGFSVEKYAMSVCRELIWGLEGLVEIDN